MFKNTLSQSARLMGKNPREHSSSVLVSGVCVDTRLIQTGNLFFALNGAITDGHLYLDEAAKKGVCAAVVREDYQGESYGLPLIRVEDPLIALQLLAKNLLLERTSQIVAITGSVGKTTTKDFVSTLLKEKYVVASSPGNQNSQIGTPLAILNHTTGDEEIIVLEMGMTHPGHLKKLIDIAPPDIAIITTVALVHACNFDSINEIARTKAEIFLHPKTKTGIIHRDIENFEELVKIGDSKKISFSTSLKESDYFLDCFSDHFQLVVDGKAVEMEKPLMMGRHNFQNLLAAVACARCFDMSWMEIQNGIKRVALPQKRLQLVEKDGILFVNDSYNASAISVNAALESLPLPKKGGKKIAVLGDMLELGKFSEESHRNVANTALHYVDSMYCLGNESRYIFESWQEAGRQVYWFDNQMDLIKELKNRLKADDVVLLKASRSFQLWKVLEDW